MRRRDFCLGSFALIAADPTPLKLTKPNKIKMVLLWQSHEGDAIKINLIYEDGTNVITTIPYTWLHNHPIETKLAMDGWRRPDMPYMDWVGVCAEIVDLYVHGK